MSIFSGVRPSFNVLRNKLRLPYMRRNALRGMHVVSSPGSQYTQQDIKKITIDLSTARTDVQFNISGTILWAERCFNQADNSPNTTAFFAVRISNITADQLNWSAGNGIEGISFSRIFFSNTVQAGVSVELVYFSDTPQAPSRFF